MIGEYRMMKGVEARERLNELGYAVPGHAELQQGLLCVVVALAERIDEHEKHISRLTELLAETTGQLRRVTDIVGGIKG